jgi:hypothetical protein
VSYANLLDAMLGHMRATPALVAAFGDDPSALETDKFWAMPVRKCQLPWAGYVDVNGNVTWMTGEARVSIEESAIQFVVVADGKDKALELVRLLADTLTDPPLVFDDGKLMYFRPGSPSAIPITSILPECPNGYAYGVTFSTMTQRST